MLFSAGLLHVPRSSSRKGQQRGYEAEQSKLEEMEMTQCRGLAREERITERVQGQPMGGVGLEELLRPQNCCVGTQRGEEQKEGLCRTIWTNSKDKKEEEATLRKEWKGEESKERNSDRKRPKHRLEDMVQKCKR